MGHIIYVCFYKKYYPRFDTKFIGKLTKNSLKRFISRRDCPENVISDNGSNFVAIETQNFASNFNIKWHFNLAFAPCQWGFFERLMRSGKELLKKDLQNYKITFDELQTILLEAELIINNRPLSHISTDSTELPLTPSQHREKLTNIINHFWYRWLTKNVTNLREDQKLRSLNNNSPYVKVNDVVLIHDDNAPRHLWRIDRVIELIKSKSDNEVRGASVKVLRTGRMVQRPTNKSNESNRTYKIMMQIG